MSLDANTWYAIQSFGTDFNFAAGNRSNSTTGAAVLVQSNGRSDNALWQVVTGSEPTSPYLRSKAVGAAYCLTGNTSGELNISPCQQNQQWTIAFFNGVDSTGGRYLAPGSSATSPRLYSNGSGGQVSLRDYTGVTNDDSLYQWGFVSVSAINDAAFSTLPFLPITSSSSTVTTTTTSPTTTSPTTTIPTTTSTTTSGTTPSTTTVSTTTVPPPVETFTETITFTDNPAGTNTNLPSVQTRTDTVTVTRSRPTSSVTTTTRSTTPTISPTTIPGSASFSTQHQDGAARMMRVIATGTIGLMIMVVSRILF